MTKYNQLFKQQVVNFYFEHHENLALTLKHFNLAAKTVRYWVSQSMSRKGNCLDNACAENFFSHIKSELVNRVKWENYEEAKDAIDEYIRYYNNDRIQIKLKKAPMQYRSLFIE